MAQSENNASPMSLPDYLAVVARRKGSVFVIALVVPLIAGLHAWGEPKVYAGSADVLVNQRDLTATVTGISDATFAANPDRVVQTEADLAREPVVARRTLRSAGVEAMSPGSFLAASSVTPASNSDVLRFEVRNKNPHIAAKLATAYAQQATTYRQGIDRAVIGRAMTDVDRRIGILRRRHATGSPLYRALLQKRRQLGTLMTLAGASAYVVRESGHAVRVAPNVSRDVLIGLALGLLLAIGYAFLRDTFDRRVRTADEARTLLGLPLLGRIPPPPVRMRRRSELIMLVAPGDWRAEGYRTLRANLGLQRRRADFKTVMVTSAVEGEGKSTTVANLAVAIARAGESVAVIDLDVRRHTVGRMFGVDGERGLVDIVRHEATVKSSLVPVPRGYAQGRGAHGSDWLDQGGMVHLLHVGSASANDVDLLASPIVADVFRDLRERFDVVLVDGPPLLDVADGVASSALVNGLVIVSRLGAVTRSALRELRRTLATCPSPALGVVVTAASLEPGYGYGYRSTGGSGAPTPEATRAGQRQ